MTRLRRGWLAAARDAFERMMAEHDCSPADVILVEAKPIAEVEPHLLGGLLPSDELTFWIYEATAA